MLTFYLCSCQAKIKVVLVFPMTGNFHKFSLPRRYRINLVHALCQSNYIHLERRNDLHLDKCLCSAKLVCHVLTKQSCKYCTYHHVSYGGWLMYICAHDSLLFQEKMMKKPVATVCCPSFQCNWLRGKKKFDSICHEHSFISSLSGQYIQSSLIKSNALSHWQ